MPGGKTTESGISYRLGTSSFWTQCHVHLIEKHYLLRANTALLLTLVWGGLAACAFGAVIFDVGRLLNVW
jgi:hypothetical protein